MFGHETMIAPGSAPGHQGARRGHTRWQHAPPRRTLVTMDASAPPAPPVPPGPPQPPPAPPRQHLRRDRANRVLGGVAAGIARTYGIDVTLVRVLWIIAAIAWIGIPAYVVAWIAIPPDDGSLADERPRDIGLLAGLALIFIGVCIAANYLLPGGFLFGGRFVAPLFLIGGGIAILVLRRPGRPTTDEPAFAATTQASTAETDAIPTVEPSPEPATTGETEATTTPSAEPASAWTQTAPWPTFHDARRAHRLHRRERRAHRPRPFLTPLTLSLLLIAAGVTSFLQAIEAIEVNLTVAFAIATCAVGAVLVLSAWVGRARGLIFLGVLLVAATAVSSTIDVPLRGGVGEHRYHPMQLADVRPTYELAIGHMYLDLRDVPLAGETVNVNASVGIGRLELRVPSAARVEIDAHAGAGSLVMFGRHYDGWHRDARRTVEGDVPGAGVLHLKLRVGAGEVDVHRFQPGGVETLIGASG
jgi:phage shock protein PspC (stress-responsive transcriptional regulator)/predicted membrane protein